MRIGDFSTKRDKTENQAVGEKNRSEKRAKLSILASKKKAKLRSKIVEKTNSFIKRSKASDQASSVENRVKKRVNFSILAHKKGENYGRKSLKNVNSFIKLSEASN